MRKYQERIAKYDSTLESITEQETDVLEQLVRGRRHPANLLSKLPEKWENCELFLLLVMTLPSESHVYAATVCKGQAGDETSGNGQRLHSDLHQGGAKDCNSTPEHSYQGALGSKRTTLACMCAATYPPSLACMPALCRTSAVHLEDETCCLKKAL